MDYGLFLFFTCVPLVLSNTATNVQTFLDDIQQPPTTKSIDDYDTAVRPKTNQDDPLAVTMTLGITSIKDFTEESSVLEVMGFVELEWTDELLVSRLTNAGITTINITLSQEDIYMPLIVMRNSVEDLVRVGHTSVPVVLRADGSVYWKSNFDMEIYCSVDASYYPFDTHNCEIRFMPWEITSEVITLNPQDSIIDLSQYDENPSWEVVSTVSSHIPGLYSTTIYTLKIQRRGAFFTMYFIFPLLLMGVLSSAVFIVPYDQARIRYLVSSLLVVSIIMNIVADEVPKTTSPIPYIVFFIDWQFLLYWMLLTYVSSTLHIYHRHGKSKVTGCLSCFVSLLWCFPCRGKTLGDWKPPPGYGILNKRFKLQAASPFVKEVKIKRRQDDDGEDDVEKEKRVPRIKWKTVGSTMDIFYFFAFLALNIIVYSIFMANWLSYASGHFMT